MTIAAIGDLAVIQGLGLAGALVAAADTPEQARAAWAGLGPEVGLVLITGAVARALEGLPEPRRRLRVVLP